MANTAQARAGTDWTRSASRRIPLLLIGAALAVALIACSFLFDDAVGAFFKLHQNAANDHLASFFNKWGDFPPLIIMGLAGLAYGSARRDRRLTQIFLAMVMSCLLAGAIADTTRFVTGRARPGADVSQGFHGIVVDGDMLHHKNKYRSFPSAHTSCAIGFTGVLLFAWWPVGLIAVLGGCAVGCARLYVGAHHISDVVTGGVVGMASAYWAWHWLASHPGWVDAACRRRSGDEPPIGSARKD